MIVTTAVLPLTPTLSPLSQGEGDEASVLHTANAQGLRAKMRRTIGSKASIGRGS